MSTTPKQPKQQFRHTGTLKRDDWVIAEIENNKAKYPQHVGTLWIDAGWFDVQRATELRDFLNELLEGKL